MLFSTLSVIFKMKRYLKLASIFIVGLVLGIGLNTLVINKQSSGLKNPNNEIRLGGYRYTNPLLECEYNQSIGNAEFKPSKQKIENIIAQKRQNGEISDISLYYRDLNNGPWFGINENSPYAPASLLKLPLMMAYFKWAESDLSILKKQITFKKKPEPLEQNFMPQKRLDNGKTYTIEELIEHMMTYSDNDALFLLQDNIDKSRFDNLTSELGIETLANNGPEDYLSVKSYATLIRVLFNSSYLSRSSSEKALQIMAKANFPYGLMQGVPSGIEIANKFGERGSSNNSAKQLHDCGIIYYPNHPYLLCIMTKGNDINQLSKTIGEVSRQIYEDINIRFQK